MTNRIVPPAQPPTTDEALSETQGPAAGLCARCVHGVVTVMRCGSNEPWRGGMLTSVAACHCPTSALKQILAPVVACDGYAIRAERR